MLQILLLMLYFRHNVLEHHKGLTEGRLTNT